MTCKARRVKCDESKPACARCQKFGIVCGGYLVKLSGYVSAPAGAQILLPRAQSSVQPSTSLFDTEQERRYFTFFSDNVVAEVLPYFDSTPWRYMILQACAAEPSIRHAATAIGALGKTIETVQSGRGRRPGASHHRAPALGNPIETAQRVKSRISRGGQLQEAVLHHQYALEQYHKAIKQMQSIASRGNIRTALITCIIIIFFENLHGNQDSVSAQLQSGIALLQDWKKNERDAAKHPKGFLSPAPDLIEDYLVQFFGRLEIEYMSFRDSRGAECHRSLKEEGKEVIKQMPTLLASINQARVYLDLIMRRMMHFTASINHMKVSYAQYKERLTQMTGQQDSWIDRKPGAQVPQLPDFSSYASEQQALSSELDAWFAAFQPLLNRSIARGRKDCVSALTLDIAARTSSISIRATFIKAETNYDVFESEFNTIVTHSALLLRTLENCMPKSKPKLAFSLELSVLPPLFLTAVKCRTSEIRKEALELLVRYPRREGIWDSVTVAAIGKWVIELEEEGATGGYVSEEDRVRKATIVFDLVERKATMSCLKLNKETGELDRMEKDITW